MSCDVMGKDTSRTQIGLRHLESLHDQSSNTARRWSFLDARYQDYGFCIDEVYKQGLSQWISRQDINDYAPYCVVTLDLSQKPSESPNLVKSVAMHKTPPSTSI